MAWSLALPSMARYGPGSDSLTVAEQSFSLDEADP